MPALLRVDSQQNLEASGSKQASSSSESLHAATPGRSCSQSERSTLVDDLSPVVRTSSVKGKEKDLGLDSDAEKQSMPILVCFAEDDEENPFNWPRAVCFYYHLEDRA